MTSRIRPWWSERGWPRGAAAFDEFGADGRKIAVVGSTVLGSFRQVAQMNTSATGAHAAQKRGLDNVFRLYRLHSISLSHPITISHTACALRGRCRNRLVHPAVARQEQDRRETQATMLA
jgi:hypothetical protein